LVKDDEITATVTDPVSGRTGEDGAIVDAVCASDGKPSTYIDQTPATAVEADGVAFHTVTVHVRDSVTCEALPDQPVTWVKASQLTVKSGTTPDTVTNTAGEAKVQYTSTVVNKDPGWEVNARVNNTLLTEANLAPVKLKYTSNDLTVAINEPVHAGDPITGTATDPATGNPVSGGPVVVKDDAGNTVCTTTTNSDGTWSCTPTTPLVKDDEITATVTDPSTGKSGSDDAIVEAVCPDGNPSTYIDQTPAAAVDADGVAIHTVTVHVRDSVTCEAVEGATVAWIKDAKLTVKTGTTPQTVTDSNGEASVQYTATVVNTDPGYPVNARVNGTQLNASNKAPVYLKYKQAVPLDVTINEPVHAGSDPITGTATDPVTGNPVSGGNVVVTDDEGNTVCTTTTGSDGTWSCTPTTPLEEGDEITATVTDPTTGKFGEDDAIVDAKCPDGKGSTYLEVTPKTAVKNDGQETHTVTVTVRDSVTCEPVVGAKVEWLPASQLIEKPPAKQLVTDDQGKAKVTYASFSANPDPGWAVNAKVNGTQLNAKNDAPVYLKYGGGALDVEINEPVKAGEPITGTATDPETGNPVSGGSVVVTGDAGNTVCTATTNADGTWSCTPTTPLEKGDEITATVTDPSTGKSGSDDAIVDRICDTDGKPSTYIDQTPTAAVDADGSAIHTVTVHVRDSVTCLPVSGAKVEWQPDSHLSVKTGTTPQTVTNDAGEAKVQYTATVVNIDPGYPVNAKVNSTPLNADNYAPVYLKYKQTNALDVTINEPVKPGLPITGTASDPATGNPVSGGPVVVTDDAGNTVCTTTTNADGTWSCTPTTPLEDGDEITATVTDPTTGKTGSDQAVVNGTCDDNLPTTYIDQTPTNAVDADGVAIHTVTVHVRDSKTCEPVQGATVAWVPDSHLTVKTGTTPQTATDADGEAKVQYTATERNISPGYPVNARVNTVLLDAANNAPVYLKYKTPTDTTDPTVDVDPIHEGDDTVTGTVTDGPGNDPLPDAPVTVTDSEGNVLCETTTDSDGKFECEPNRPLQPGEEITVTATDPAGNTGEDSTEVTPDETVETCTIAVSKPIAGTNEVVTVTVTPKNAESRALSGKTASITFPAPVKSGTTAGPATVTAVSGSDGKATAPVTSSVITDDKTISAVVGTVSCGSKTVKWSDEPFTVDVPPVEEGGPVTGTTDAPPGSEVVVTADTDGDGDEDEVCTATVVAGTAGGPNTFSCTPSEPLDPDTVVTVTVTDPETGNSGSDTAQVTPNDVVDPTKSTLTVTPATVEQGDKVTVKVETKNAQDRPLPGKPVNVTIPTDWTCQGISGTTNPHVVLTGSTGVWESECTTKEAGTKTVEAKSGTDPLNGSPATVTVQAKDPWDVDIDEPHEGDDTVTGSTDAPPGTPVVITGDTNDDGIPDWTCETTVKADGTFECELDEPLGPDDHIHVVVDPDGPAPGEADSDVTPVNKPDSDQSKLTVTPRDPVVDDPITVKVETKNEFGRPVSGPIDVTIPEEWTCTANGASVPTGSKQTITTNTQGVWEATCTSKVAGDYEVKAENPADTDSDKNIAGSPATVTVKPGTPTEECDPQEGKTTGPGTTLTKAPAGPIHPDGEAAYTLTMTVKDKYCNIIPNYPVTWTANNALSAKGTPSAQTNDEGLATAQYTSLTENLDPGFPVKAKAGTVEKSVNLTFDGAPTPPAINVANETEISGTVSDPDAKEVEVTYPKQDGTEGTVTCPVDKATMTWRCDTPTDAVNGPIEAVTVDDGGQRSEPTQGDLDKTKPVITENPVNPNDKVITGNVTDDGQPLPNAPVHVKDSEGNDLCKNPDSVFTDANGNFTCVLTRPLNPDEDITIVTEDEAGNVTEKPVHVPPILDTDLPPEYTCDGIERDTKMNTSVGLEVQDHLAGCVDGGEAPWKVTEYEEPQHATLEVTEGAAFGFALIPGGASEVTHVPETNWKGTDHYTITVTDANNESLVIPVTVNVKGADSDGSTTTTTPKVKTGGDILPGTMPWAAAGLALSGLLALALAGASRRRRQDI
jgi:hypothetical protein